MPSLRSLIAWPRHGLSLGQYARLRLLPRGRPGRARLLGRELHFLDPIDLLTGLDQIFRRGIYDVAPATPAPRIIDCGANIGLACLRWGLRHPAARIVAFEPAPRAAAALRANLAAFGLGRVELHRAAVWSAPGRLPFCAAGSLSGRVLAGPAEATSVAAVRLRDWLDEPADLLKLDIEGAELAVLEDCADRLGQLERIFVEYHSPAGAPQQLARLVDLLAGAGFRLYLRDEYGPGQPFLERPARGGFDMQLAIHALRQP